MLTLKYIENLEFRMPKVLLFNAMSKTKLIEAELERTRMIAERFSLIITNTAQAGNCTQSQLDLVPS